MFARLFPRLTATPRRGQALFDATVAEARAPHWFVAGGAEDSLDGRFAVLAGVAALVLVRLERDGPAGDAASVALTERIVESLDAELRQMGIGDPTLGKQVRELVGKLATRVGQARAASQSGAWLDFAERAILRSAPPSAAAADHVAQACAELWRRLGATDGSALTEGTIE